MIARIHLLVLLLFLISISPIAAEEPPLLVTDLADADTAQRLLAVSLQGVANSTPDGRRVFLLTNPSDADWLDYCLRVSPRDAHYLTPEELLSILAPSIEGQILYDPDQPFTLDLATTAAGLRRAVISATDLGLPTVLDFRDRWHSAAAAHRWATDSLLPQCSRSCAALLPPDALALRDFAIQQRMFTFSPPLDPDDESFQTFLHHLPPGTAIYGHAPLFLRPALSDASHHLITASNAANLSFLSQIGTDEVHYQHLGYLQPAAPRFLTLILDCSELDFAINEMPHLWDHPARGTFPLGWALPAALTRAAPPVAHYYYSGAYRSGVDQFILGPSGAGEIDLSRATAPYTFFRATAEARAALDITAGLYTTSPGADIPVAVARLAAETDLRGLFLLGAPDLAPIVYEGVPALAAPRVSDIAAAISYLNRIPLDRRFAALCLDPDSLSMAEAAHIAAHVADRFVLLPPGEMIELMRDLRRPDRAGAAAARVTSVDYPEPAHPDLPLPITAVVEAPEGVFSASVVYRRSDSGLAFSEPMCPSQDGYTAEIPPLRCGGQFDLRVRVRDRLGRATWSPAWRLSVPRSDTDDDGLSDSEEHYLLTDQSAPDTDGDGLADGDDPTPLDADKVFITYLGPIQPPSDIPYLPDPGASHADPHGRYLEPGQRCLYWLPLPLLPPDAPAVIALDARGPALLAIGADPTLPSQHFEGELTGIWYSDILPGKVCQGGAFLRIGCPDDADAPSIIHQLAVVSPPHAPSIARAACQPPHPGPEQAIGVSALIFGPRGVADAALTYRMNDGGTITFPMERASGSQLFRARIPALANRDRLEWWITARDSENNTTVTIPVYLPIGGRAREVISLIAGRDFVGDWAPAAEWSGLGRQAPSSGLRDSAYLNLTGGIYTVWLLGGGRGQSVEVYIGEERVGSLDPRSPDGWHQFGRVRLAAGRHQVHLLSQPGPSAPDGAAPRYAAVILSADSSFSPPAGRILDVHNTLSLLSPPPDHTLTGRVELRATGSGNLVSAEFSLDGELLRRVPGPPFHLSLNTARLPQGPHILRVEAVDRAGPSGLIVEVPVTIAN